MYLYIPCMLKAFHFAIPVARRFYCVFFPVSKASATLMRPRMREAMSKKMIDALQVRWALRYHEERTTLTNDEEWRIYVCQ